MQQGQRVRFTYPDYGTPVGYPEHVAHSGQFGVVVRELSRGDATKGAEVDEEVGPMFVVRFDDGWEGHIFGDEIEEA